VQFWDLDPKDPDLIQISGEMSQRIMNQRLGSLGDFCGRARTLESLTYDWNLLKTSLLRVFCSRPIKFDKKYVAYNKLCIFIFILQIFVRETGTLWQNK
jgi:hypothetical protein